MTVKLTKNELKKQKDALKLFVRFLPTLQLKKQQLQMVMRQIEHERDALLERRRILREDMDLWIGVFSDGIDLVPYAGIREIETSTGNVAGVEVPVFEEIRFTEAQWDLLSMPIWVDTGVRALRELLELDARLEIFEEELRRLSEELRTTTQRVNLFEKVKIPEARENIRKIRIYLGDQQTAEVVRGKIAKRRLVGAAA
jgi:V/A-type H+-transporting ATPase subunit D